MELGAIAQEIESSLIFLPLNVGEAANLRQRCIVFCFVRSEGLSLEKIMSPKLFIYNGIELLFFSNDHLPVHVHAIYEKRYGMKVEFTKKNNKISKIEYKGLKGYKKFKPAQMRDLKKLIAKYADQITNDWIDFYVQGTKIKTRVITKKL